MTAARIPLYQGRTEVIDYNGVSPISPRALTFHNIYKINDLPPTINISSEPIIFADDTSVIISSKMFDDFCAMSNIVLSHMNKWFNANRLALNIDKTNIMKFTINNSP
jgi:hypothetical protein